MEGQGVGRGTEGGWRDADWVEGQGVDGGGRGWAEIQGVDG